LNAQVYGYSALIGIGAGCFIQAGFSVAQAKVHPSEEADATSLMSLAQNLGITFSLAISGSVFRSQAIDNLQKILPDLSKDELRGAITGNDSGVITHLDYDNRAKLIHAIVKAMSHTYFLVVSAGVMAVIGSAYLKVSFGEYSLLFRYIFQLTDVVTAGAYFYQGCRRGIEGLAMIAEDSCHEWACVMSRVRFEWVLSGGFTCCRFYVVNMCILPVLSLILDISTSQSIKKYPSKFLTKRPSRLDRDGRGKATR
jgi:hypothetical protein